MRDRIKYLLVMVLCLTTLLALPGCTPNQTKANPASILAAIKNSPKKALKYPIMRYTAAERAELEALDKSLPAAPIDKDIVSQLRASKTTSFSLLNHIQYNAVERDQGSCGNCWVWANTGALEVALDVQRSIKDKLSVQYYNSTYNNGTGYYSDCNSNPCYACCGGNPYKFVNHYKYALKKAVPWSAGNAGWADITTCCCNSCSSCNTVRPASSIDTTNTYNINSIGPVYLIPTHTAGEYGAIENIKSYLYDNKAVIFALRLPTEGHWALFQAWWEGLIFLGANFEAIVPYFYWSTYEALGCGYNWDNGGGHEMLCVGWYDDGTVENSYWIMLNSWGNANGLRPDGLIRMPMYINYDCATPANEYVTSWYTFPVVFETTTPCSLTCNKCLTESAAAGMVNMQKCSASPCGFAADGFTKKYCYRDVTPNPIPPVKRKIDYLSTNLRSVAPGEEAVISWGITGDGNAYLTCGGETRQVPLSGSVAIKPPQSGCCTLTVGDEGNGDTRTICITVVPAQVAAPVINAFTASCATPSPTQRVPAPCTLSWSVAGPAGTTVTISGVGSVGLSGTAPAVRGNTYTLTATSSGGSVSRTVQAQ